MAGKDKVRAAVMAAARPADAARALNMDGKAFRNVLRNVLGVYVSHGDAFDDRVKAAAYGIVTAKDAATRKRIADAYKQPAPKRTRTRKQNAPTPEPTTLPGEFDTP